MESDELNSVDSFEFHDPVPNGITPRTYPQYLRFRNEAEYLAFALKWS